MEQYKPSGTVGAGLHDRGPTAAPLSQRHVFAGLLWREIDYHTYCLKAVSWQGWAVYIIRMNESMFLVKLVDHNRETLFYTMAADIYEAKIIGDAVYAFAHRLTPRCNTDYMLMEAFNWDEQFIQQFRNFLKEGTQSHITRPPSSATKENSILKDFFSLNGKEVTFTFTDAQLAATTSPEDIIHF